MVNPEKHTARLQEFMCCNKIGSEHLSLFLHVRHYALRDYSDLFARCLVSGGIDLVRNTKALNIFGFTEPTWAIVGTGRFLAAVQHD